MPGFEPATAYHCLVAWSFAVSGNRNTDLMRGARMELDDRRLNFFQRTDDEFT
jgi:hypothetical protein